jgi:NAD(P)-dependent dehydrogenase (short-subunit alcohol dehydrogenase family)
MPVTSNGRVALVTGGSRGIGRAVVESLLGEGWTVHFCGRTQGSVSEAEQELRPRFGARVAGRTADVRQEAAVGAFVEEALQRSGRIDCLVNNAGVGIFAPVHELSGEAWREVIETNLSGAFYAIRAVAPAMRQQGGGWIFNIASLAARNPFASGAAYNASKFGMVGLSEAAMLDLRHDGIRVAAILPGSVDTEFGMERRDPDRNWMLAPADIARVVTDLLRFPERALPSLIEIRPSQPPRR